MKRNHNVKNDTLSIYYKNDSNSKAYLSPEILTTKNPDKVISKRNAPRIKKVLYGGVPFDISKHMNLYPDNKLKD